KLNALEICGDFSPGAEIQRERTAGGPEANGGLMNLEPRRVPYVECGDGGSALRQRTGLEPLLHGGPRGQRAQGFHPVVSRVGRSGPRGARAVRQLYVRVVARNQRVEGQ